MAFLSEDQKDYISRFIETGKSVLHYGWIPFVLYVGYTRSSPQPSLMKLISPLA